jgi:hypothetical protein
MERLGYSYGGDLGQPQHVSAKATASHGASLCTRSNTAPRCGSTSSTSATTSEPTFARPSATQP